MALSSVTLFRFNRMNGPIYVAGYSQQKSSALHHSTSMACKMAARGSAILDGASVVQTQTRSCLDVIITKVWGLSY